MCSSSSHAQNLIPSGEFDSDPIDAGWSVNPNAPVSLGPDSDECQFSFSFHVGSFPAVPPFQLSEAESPCFPVVEGTRLFTSLRTLSPASGSLYLDLSSDANCGSYVDTIGFIPSGFSASASFATTTAQSTLIPTGQGIVSAAIGFSSDFAGEFEVVVDRWYVGASNPIYLDDFEAQETCRWSLTQ